MTSTTCLGLWRSHLRSPGITFMHKCKKKTIIFPLKPCKHNNIKNRVGSCQPSDIIWEGRTCTSALWTLHPCTVDCALCTVQSFYLSFWHTSSKSFESDHIHKSDGANQRDRKLKLSFWAISIIENMMFLRKYHTKIPMSKMYWPLAGGTPIKQIDVLLQL